MTTTHNYYKQGPTQLERDVRHVSGVLVRQGLVDCPWVTSAEILERLNRRLVKPFTRERVSQALTYLNRNAYVVKYRVSATVFWRTVLSPTREMNAHILEAAAHEKARKGRLRGVSEQSDQV